MHTSLVDRTFPGHCSFKYCIAPTLRPALKYFPTSRVSRPQLQSPHLQTNDRSTGTAIAAGLSGQPPTPSRSPAGPSAEQDQPSDRLSRAIRAAGTYTELHGLITQHGEGLNRDQILHALVKICKLNQHHHPWIGSIAPTHHHKHGMRRWRVLTRRRDRTMRHQTRLQQPPAPAAAQRRPLSLFLPPGSSLLHRALRVLITSMQPCMDDLDPLEATYLAMAMALSGYHDPQLLTAITKQCYSLLPMFTMNWLSKLMWSMGVLRHRPAEAWLKAAENVCMSQSHRTGAYTSIRLIEAFAMMSYRPHPALLTDITRRLQPRLEWLTPHQQAILIHSLVTLRFAPSESWLKLFVQYIRVKLKGFTPLQHIQVVGALARYRYVPPSWWLKYFERYSQELLARRVFTPGQQAELLYSLARLNLEPNPRWINDCLYTIRGVQDFQSRYVPSGCTYRSRDGLSSQTSSSNTSTSSTGFNPGSIGINTGSTTGSSSSTDTSNTSAAPGPAGVPASPSQHEAAAAQQPHLTVNQLSKVAYAVAKMRDKPSVQRHVAWVKQQLPRLLREQPEAAAATAAMPASTRGAATPPAGTTTQSRRRLRAARKAAAAAATTTTTPHESALPGEEGRAESHAGEASPAAEVSRAQPADGAASGTDASSANSPEGASTPDRAVGAAALAIVPDYDYDGELTSGSYSQQLVDRLYVCAELSYKPSEDDLNTFLTRLEGQFPEFSPANCATVMVSLAVMRRTPSNQWTSSFFTTTLHLMSRFRAQELANMMTAAAHLRLQPPAELSQAAVQHASRFDLVELAMLVRKLDQSKSAVEVAWLAEIKSQVKQIFGGRA